MTVLLIKCVCILFIHEFVCGYPQSPILTGESGLADKTIAVAAFNGMGSTWQANVTLIIKTPNFTYCQVKCFNLDKDIISAALIKEGWRCNCIFKVVNNTTYKLCRNFCEEDERLEGSERDVCNYVDKKCYTSKYLMV